MPVLLINATANVHAVSLAREVLGNHDEVYVLVEPSAVLPELMGERVHGDVVHLSRAHLGMQLVTVPHSGWFGQCAPVLTDVQRVHGIACGGVSYELDIDAAAPHVRRIADTALSITYTGAEPVVVVIASEITARALRDTLECEEERERLDPTDVLRGRGTMPVLIASPVLDGTRKFASALRVW